MPAIHSQHVRVMPLPRHRRPAVAPRAAAVFVTLALCGAPLAAQQTPQARGDASRLTVERIFRRNEFASAPMPSVHWLKDGASYIDLRAAEPGGADIVRVELATGRTTVLAPASALVDESGRRLDVEELTLSDDETKALLFHSSVRVWRTNTRGAYHVIDFATKTLTPVSRVRGDAGRPSGSTDTVPGPILGKNPNLSPSFLAPPPRTNLQMFAKFSPDAKRVAFVRDNDLFVMELATGAERRLTTDGSADIINGTTDWVYEEELDLRDAFRWSPDGTKLAYWRFDQSAIPAFPMVDETVGQYPSVGVLRYPKAGRANSRVQVGVLDLGTGRTQWIDVGADTGIYLARMEWAGLDSVVVQRLARRQNRLDVLMASAATGRTRTLLTDRDSAYVDVMLDEPMWVNGGRQFLWLSDRSGWRAVYLYNRDGSVVRQVTADGMDVTALLTADEARGDVYVAAAGPTPTQRQIYRFPLRGQPSAAGRAGVQVTVGAGNHVATIGPGARYLVDYFSRLHAPPTATLYELPSMRRVRVMEDNAELAAKLAALRVRAPEFFRIPMPDGTQLDAYRIVPPDFDSTRKYPVLTYVYGGPAAPQVVDQWTGGRYLWHQSLAQQGYVVTVVDNRGAAWRGRDFRKVTQLHLGRYESRDQIDAAKWLGRQSWVDAGRIGIWGWSYGGYMATLCAARGGTVYKAAIAVAPVTDFRLYDTIYTERFMWTPQENAAGYREAAPLSHLEGLTANFLVVHGTGDDNVHPQNTIQLINRLEELNKPFQMMLYPNRTHSISGGNSQAHLFETLTRFVLQNL